MDATYVSSSSFTVTGDRTAEFISGRRIKANCGSDGTKYATILSSSYSSPDTTVIIDETTLTSNLVEVLYGIVSPGQTGSIPDHSHDGSEGSGGTVSGTGGGGGTSDVQSFLDLNDTPEDYENGSFLMSTASGIEFVTLSGSTPYFIKAGLSSDQAITTGTPILAIDTFVDGNPVLLSSGTNSLIAPIDGRYNIKYQVSFVGGTADYTDSYELLVQVKVNSSIINTYRNGIEHGGGWNGMGILGEVPNVSLNSGDSVQFLIGQWNQDARDIDSDSTKTWVYMEYPASLNIQSGGGTSNHSELNELDYASSGHTGFQPAGDYITDAEMTTISGDITAQIPTDFYSTSEVDNLVTTASGDVVSQIVTDHSALNNLDYASAGHTGFSPDTHEHTTFSGTSVHVDGDATVTGTMYAHVYDSYSPIHIKDDGTTAMLGDGSGVIDFPVGLTISGSPIGTGGGSSDVQSFLDLDDTPSSYDEGKYLRSTASGIEFVEAELSGYPYAGSGIQSIKVEYKDADEIYIGKGVTHINDGSDGLYSVESRFAKQLTSLTSGLFYYIYVKPPTSGNVLTSSEIEYTTTAPEEDLNKMGLYHPTNTSWRCIFAIHASATNTIRVFYNYNNRIVWDDDFDDDDDNTPSNVWTTQTLETPLWGNNPVAIVTIRCGAVDTTTGLWYRTDSSPGGDHYLAWLDLSTSTHEIVGPMDVICTSSGTIDTRFADATAANYARIRNNGFVLPDNAYTGPVYTSVSGTGGGGGTSDVASFLDLTDTPTTYSGTQGYYLTSTASGIEFTPSPSVFARGTQSLKVEYNDGTNIYVSAGTVHINDGTNDNYYVVQSKLTKSVSVSAGWMYVYAKPPTSGNILSSSDIEVVTSVPTLDEDKRGYYHTTNTSWRCIGFVYCTSVISPWTQTANEYDFHSHINDLAWASQTADTDVDFAVTVPFGGLIVKALIRGGYSAGGNSNVYVHTGGGTSTQKVIFVTHSASTYPSVYLLVPTDSSKQIGVYQSSYANHIGEYTHGFIVPEEIYNSPAKLADSSTSGGYPYAGAGIQSIKVTYKDADEVYFNPGVVHINDGSDGLYRVESQFSKVVVSTSTGFYYIYVKPPTTGNTITSDEIESTQTAPTEDLNKMGFYHPTNTSWRCIFAVNAFAADSMRSFYINNNDVFWNSYITQDQTDSQPSNSWSTQTLRVPLWGDNPVLKVTFRLQYVDADAYASYRITGSSGNSFLGYTTSTSSRDQIPMDIPTNSDGQIDTVWNASTTNYLYIANNGFVLPDKIYTGPMITIVSGTGGGTSDVQSFLDLTDTPSTYSGTEGQYLMSTGSGTQWSEVSAAGTFLDLTDTPAAYDSGKYLKSTVSGIDFVDLISSSTVFAHYSMSNGQSIPHNTGERLNFDEVIVDTHDAVTTGTNWVFTVPEDGYYCCWVKIQYDTFSWSGYLANIGIYLPGFSRTVDYNSPPNGVYTLHGFAGGYAEAGQQIYSNAWQNTGGDRALRSLSSQVYNYIQIFKLGGLESSTVDNFLELTDTPSAYETTVSGSEARGLIATASGIEFTYVEGKNLIINGCMRLSQRGFNSATTISNADYSVDRWRWTQSGAGVVTAQHSSDHPTGTPFNNSLRIDVTTADASLTGTDNYEMSQLVEAQNLQGLYYATPYALNLILSFWIKSNVTGNMGGFLYRPDSTRIMPIGYTINSADTWERKTFLVVGDTQGVIDNDNGAGIGVYFSLGNGPDRDSGTKGQWSLLGSAPNQTAVDSNWNTNIMASTSNYLSITGVQLEVGSVATDFEYLPIDALLTKCQRYYEKSYDLADPPGTTYSVNSQYGALTYICQLAGGVLYQYGSEWRFNTRKRATPTVTIYSPVNGTSGYAYSRTAVADTGAASTVYVGNHGVGNLSITGGLSVDERISWHFTAEAEL